MDSLSRSGPGWLGVWGFVLTKYIVMYGCIGCIACTEYQRTYRKCNHAPVIIDLLESEACRRSAFKGFKGLQGLPSNQKPCLVSPIARGEDFFICPRLFIHFEVRLI